MKNAWSTKWIASVQPRKQRKYVANAPPHKRRAMMGVTLSKELRKKQGTRSVAVRKGDKVKIVRGQYKGKEGVIERVDTKKVKVYLTGIEVNKRDGSKQLIPFHPSNTMIITLETNDKKRFKRQKKQ